MGKPYIPYLSMLRFLKTGERIHVLERYMNTREGISKKDDTLPRAAPHRGPEVRPSGRTVPLEKMLKRYYNARGFDRTAFPRTGS